MMWKLLDNCKELSRCSLSFAKPRRMGKPPAELSPWEEKQGILVLVLVTYQYVGCGHVIDLSLYFLLCVY